MDSSAAARREFRYDAFISYSHRDRAFARLLEQELGRYRPPKDLAVPQRYLRIFRDEADFTGSEYHHSLDLNLREAAKLIVICSPSSASSEYVGDEISRFAECRGKEHVIPVLLDGLPNNEAKGEDASRRAFSEQLVRLLPIPLAADYRGFDTKGNKIRKGPFEPAWFKTLADIYADYGVDRARIEQRERRREVQRLRRMVAIGAAVALALIALTIWALLSRHEATRQRDNSEARRHETEARLVFGNSGDALVKAILLSVASVTFTRTVDGHISLTRFLALLPRPPVWRESVAQPSSVVTGGRHRALAVSPDGARVAVVGGSGPAQFLDARTGESAGHVDVSRSDASKTVLAFSPNGALLVLGCGHQACVIDVASGKLLTRLPSAEGAGHGSMVWSASFSPDGECLAMSSYGSGEVFVYDVSTWQTTATIRSGASTVFSVAFSPNGEWLAVGAPPALQLWRVGRYEAPAAQARTSSLVWSIAFQPDSSGFIAAGQSLQTWKIVSEGDTARLDAAASTPIEAHTVLPVSWHGRSCFAAATSDAVHLLCDSPFDEVLRVPLSSAAAAISPDGQWLFNMDRDGNVAAWPLEAGSDALRRIGLGAPIRSMASVEQRKWLAAGTHSGEVAVVDLDSWKERTRLRFPGPAAPVGRLAPSSDGRWLVAVRGTSLHVFDSGVWREVSSASYEHGDTRAAFASGDRWLVIVTGTTVIVWQPGGWQERARFEHDGRIEAVRVSPDGHGIATTTHWAAGHDSGVHLTRVFDLGSGTESGWKYSSDGGSNISQAFMREEAARRKRALAGGDTASVQAASSWPSLELNEPDKRTSADNMWGVSFAGRALTLRDIAADRTIGAFEQGGQITGVGFVPSVAPRWLVSAGEDGTLAIWPIRTDELTHHACTRLRAIVGEQSLRKLAVEARAQSVCSP